MIPLALPALPALGLISVWALGLKSSAGAAAARWLNKEAAAAIAVSVAVVVLAGGLAWGVHTLRADAAAAVDSSWRERIADAARRHTEQQAAQARAAEAAAAMARAAAAEEIDVARERVAALEKALAVRTVKGQPLAMVPCIPADIARELNR